MSPLMILGIVFGSITLYGFGAGVTHGMLGGRKGWEDASIDWQVGWFFAVILWPVILPMLLGVTAVHRIGRRNLPEAIVHRRLDE